MNETRSSLLVRVRDPHDKESWREFHDLYRPILQAYVRRAGLNDADADDVVQIIFERLVELLQGFRLDHSLGRFRTWLWRLMHNAVVDWRRRQGRHQHRGLTGINDDEPSTAPEEPESWCDDLRRRVLEYSLSAVREKTQQTTWAAFEGHILNGLSSAEVAEKLGITVNQVNVNSSRVLARVKDRCREYLEDTDNDVDIRL